MTDHKADPHIPDRRRVFYYRSYRGGHRLLFSELEILSVIPRGGYVDVRVASGYVFMVQTALPDYVESLAPVPMETLYHHNRSYHE